MAQDSFIMIKELNRPVLKHFLYKCFIIFYIWDSFLYVVLTREFFKKRVKDRNLSFKKRDLKLKKHDYDII